MAGVLQMDPRPFSLRELFAMYDGAMVAAWDHTAFLIASQAAEKIHPFKLNPYRRRTKQKNTFTADDCEARYRLLMKQGKVCK